MSIFPERETSHHSARLTRAIDFRHNKPLLVVLGIMALLFVVAVTLSFDGRKHSPKIATAPWAPTQSSQHGT